MSKAKRRARYIADFETTVYQGQQKTEVWAAGLIKEGDEDAIVFNCIDRFMEYLEAIVDYDSIEVFFHNLKFDGSFIGHYLSGRDDLKPAFRRKAVFSEIGMPNFVMERVKEKDMEPGSYNYLITEYGAWYSMTWVTSRGVHIIFRDSMKLIPLSIEDMGPAFNTEHRKGAMEYEGARRAGGEITESEREYLINDLLVLKEALEFMWAQGYTAATIGGCCLNEFKRLYREERSTPNKVRYFEDSHPDMRRVKLDDELHGENVYGEKDAEDYIRRAYRGGWCYVNPFKQGKVLGEGCTFDVNSLYPSVMHSNSGNYYPYGWPHFWTGEIPKEALMNNRYYFVKIRTRFNIKQGMLPTIAINNDPNYPPHEMLITSNILDLTDGHYHTMKTDLKEPHGAVPADVELTLTMTDFEILKEHYDLIDCEILSGCWFETEKGIFDAYIEKWYDIKKNSTGGMRQLAKLFLNNLYGKMASNRRADFKTFSVDKKGILHFSLNNSYEKNVVYIPIGAAITAYAREVVIKAAQANYNGDLPGFCYADTDSIHCDCRPEEVVGIEVNDVDLSAWKLESTWTAAKFVRAKSYVECLDSGRWNIKCAGMSKRCKELFATALDGRADPAGDYTEEEKEFLFWGAGHRRRKTIDDFDFGLKIPSRITSTQIPGGVVLKKTNFLMRKFSFMMDYN